MSEIAHLLQAPGVVLVVALRAENARDSATTALTCNMVGYNFSLPVLAKSSTSLGAVYHQVQCTD